MDVRNNATITLNYWNTFVKTVGKNVAVVVLGITINYINATMIHTFNKYHVCSDICTVKRTYIVIGIIWAISSLSILPDLFILLAVETSQFLQSRVVCNRDAVFRSSYSVKKRDASHTLFLVVVSVTLLYTYCRILFVATCADSDAKKARNTILIHGFQVLLCTTVYVQPPLIKLLVYFFPERLSDINFATFIINQILPRLGSPIVYGLRDKTFRKFLKRHFQCKNNVV
uniref:G-protein coupled receptors family 1 profile domain-containing protein n=1 Tax=Oreochromis niloticus TaxID=8128 RepID=A0A669ESX0_ORENI